MHLLDAARFSSPSLIQMSWHFRRHGLRRFTTSTPEEKSEIIKARLRKGYFFGLKDALDKNQKKFEAKNELIPAQDAKEMPSFPVTTLENRSIDLLPATKGKVTCLLIGYSEHTSKMTQSFLKPFLQNFKHEKDVQCYEVSIINPFLKFLKPMLISAQKKMYPPDRLPYTAIFLKESMYIENVFGINSRFLGYSFLIDKESKIRWEAHEIATPKEVENLINLTKTLKKK